MRPSLDCGVGKSRLKGGCGQDCPPSWCDAVSDNVLARPWLDRTTLEQWVAGFDKTMRLISLLLLFAACTSGQNAVTIRVAASEAVGPFKPIYAYFGYDEPNYTYTKNGAKLVRELASMSAGPVYIRTHFMLATGDGTPGLKWGSTNAYTEDASGRPVYNWTITDRIFDTYLQAGAKPFVEIGFMPQALSSNPQPYQPTWIPGADNRDYSIGWSFPPKDYGKWGELVYQWVKHSVEKYGKEQVQSWYWEVWNEPDISLLARNS